MNNKLPIAIVITMVFAIWMSFMRSRLPAFSSSRCVFPQDVLREYKHVNKYDGVTEREAGLIAQYEFLQRDVDNFFLKIFNKIKSKDEDTWLVTFQPYADGPESSQALDVCVDKRDGGITCWEKRPLIIKQGKIVGFGPIVTQRIEAE